MSDEVKSEYLGDGVYASAWEEMGPAAIKLTTGDHRAEMADKVIYLEPLVVKAWVRYLKTHYPEYLA